MGRKGVRGYALPAILQGLRKLASKEKTMSKYPRQEDHPTEDEIAKEKLGPRGVSGGTDNRTMTPQNEKNTPKSGEFDGHVA